MPDTDTTTAPDATSSAYSYPTGQAGTAPPPEVKPNPTAMPLPEPFRKAIEASETSAANQQKSFAEEQSALAPMRGALTKALMTPTPAPPEQQPLPPAPKPDAFKNAAMNFAAVMTMIGAFGAGHTRSAGSASLKSFGAAMKGWQEGNLEAYQSSIDDWKNNTTATIANNKQLMDKYKVTLENRNLNIEQMSEAIKLTAAQYQDRQMFEAANAQNFTAIAKLYDTGVTLGQKLQTTYDTSKEHADASWAKLREQAPFWMSEQGKYEYQFLDPAGKAGVDRLINQFGRGKSETGIFGKFSPEVVGGTVDGIVSGNQPPTLTGLYGMTPYVREGLQKKGFNLAEAQLEWQRAQRQITALNSAQMTKFIGLSGSVTNTMDEVRELSRKMDLSGVSMLNRAEIESEIKLHGNSPAGQLATKYIAAINTLKSEFANLEAGGYAPHESVWKLANEQINGNFGRAQMDAALTEIKRLVNYRVQAIPGMGTLGPGAPNRYAPGGGAAPSEPETSASGGVDLRAKYGLD